MYNTCICISNHHTNHKHMHTCNNQQFETSQISNDDYFKTVTQLSQINWQTRRSRSTRINNRPDLASGDRRA